MQPIQSPYLFRKSVVCLFFNRHFHNKRKSVTGVELIQNTNRYDSKMTTVSKHTSIADRFIKCYENTYDINRYDSKMTTVSKHTSIADRFIKCYENTYDIKQLFAPVYIQQLKQYTRH